MNHQIRRLGPVLVVALLVGACSTQSSASPTTPTQAPATQAPATQAPATQAPPSTPAFDVAPFQAAADEAKQPVTYKGPTTSPPMVKGKTIAVVLCAAAAEGCVRVGNGVSEAAAAVGWQVKILDGQGQASVYNSVMLQAIASKVDGIVLVAVDSKIVGDAMAKAHEANIPVVSVYSGNKPGPTDVFAEINSQSLQQGKNDGNWVVATSKGTATIAIFTAPEFVDCVDRRAGALSVYEQCPGCKVAVDQQYVASTAGKDMGAQTKAILLANPDIDWIVTDIGGYGALQVQAINEMGLQDKVKLVSNDCNPQDLTNIREGNVQAACVASLNEESGWGAVDELNRAFNGAAMGGDLIPIKLIDTTNLPAGDKWTGDYDYASTYKKLWGIGE